MNFSKLTLEQQEKAFNCKTPDDIFNLAKEYGYKLSDDELDSIVGGGFWDCDSYTCSAYNPNCTSLYSPKPF